MPKLDYGHPLYQFTDTGLSAYTATDTCYLMGQLRNTSVSINDVSIYYGDGSWSSSSFLPPLRLEAGDTVKAATSNLNVYAVLSD